MKNKIITSLFIVFIFSFMLLNIIVPDEKVSRSERRTLKSLPELNVKTVVNGEFFSNFEEYALDQFVFRDNFRFIKVFSELNILNKSDYNNLYVKDDYIYKIEYPLNEKRVSSFSKKINKLYDKYLVNSNVYYSIIPDKNYFNKDSLRLDYDYLFSSLNDEINENIRYIDIKNDLKIGDYYYSDIHWKQENIVNIALKFADEMGFKINTNYYSKKYSPFYGSYYGQLGLNTKKDMITYLYNDAIENAIVKDYESKLDSVYEIESLGGIDSYDVYLGGASYLIEVMNTKAKSNRELIIFRDSFASSLALLLLDGYKKITLVDLRYVDYNYLDQFVDFKDKDVLILYNTSIINNSDILKIN